MRQMMRSLRDSPSSITWETIGFLYRQQGDTLTQYCAGIFKEGKWSRLSGKLKHEPSHWVVMVDDNQ